MSVAYKKVLVALDLSTVDSYLLKHLKALINVLGIEQLEVVHIIENIELSKRLEKVFKKEIEKEISILQRIRNKLSEEVSEIFPSASAIKINIEVAEGKPYQKLIDLVEYKKVDLVVVGRKKESQGSGITAKRVARNIKCAVMFVPEVEVSASRKIAVPIDFSDNSARALKNARQLCREVSASCINAIYVVDYPPTGYYLNQEEYLSFNKMLVESATGTFEKFLEKYELTKGAFNFQIIENSWHKIATAIENYTRKQDVDMLVLGAQGHSAIESFFYGSVTEKVVRQIVDIPILVVR